MNKTADERPALLLVPPVGCVLEPDLSGISERDLVVTQVLSTEGVLPNVRSVGHRLRVDLVGLRALLWCISIGLFDCLDRSLEDVVGAFAFHGPTAGA